MCSLSRAVFSMSKNMLKQRECYVMQTGREKSNIYICLVLTAQQQHNNQHWVAHVFVKHSTVEKGGISFADLPVLISADLDSFCAPSGLKLFLFSFRLKHFQLNNTLFSTLIKSWESTSGCTALEITFLLRGFKSFKTTSLHEKKTTPTEQQKYSQRMLKLDWVVNTANALLWLPPGVDEKYNFITCNCYRYGSSSNRFVLVTTTRLDVCFIKNVPFWGCLNWQHL